MKVYVKQIELRLLQLLICKVFTLKWEDKTVLFVVECKDY